MSEVGLQLFLVVCVLIKGASAVKSSSEKGEDNDKKNAFAPEAKFIRFIGSRSFLSFSEQSQRYDKRSFHIAFLLNVWLRNETMRREDTPDDGAVLPGQLGFQN